MKLQVGDLISFQRTFTKEDVFLFSNISGDKGIHHREPDELNRYVVQGLLTATLPTKIGGDYNVLARHMNFEFIRPVYTEDTITCEVKVDEAITTKNNHLHIETTFICTNQVDEKVLIGGFSGLIKNGN